MTPRQRAYGILEAAYILPTPGRVVDLAAILDCLGHDNVKIETVAHGGTDHRLSNSLNARRIGSFRRGKGSVEIWVTWEDDDTEDDDTEDDDTVECQECNHHRDGYCTLHQISTEDFYTCDFGRR